MLDRLSDFMLIGCVGAGKTSLFNALLNINVEAEKTQTLVYHNTKTIDTPGEYFDNPRLYSALIQTMVDIDKIIYVHPSNYFDRKLPYGLFRIYQPKNIIGVISKIDLLDSDTKEVKNILKDYGINDKIFEISIYQPDTILGLRNYLSGLNNAGIC